MNYTNFDLRICPEGDASFRVSVVHSQGGTAEVVTSLPYNDQALQIQLLSLQNSLLRSTAKFRAPKLPEEDSVVQFGQTLFDTFFRDEVRRLFDKSRADAGRQKKGLRVRIQCATPKLATLPWEYLFDPNLGDFLALADTTPIVRYLDVPHAARPLSIKPPLRILGMIASPADLPPIDEATEKSYIEQALKRPINEGLVELAWAKKPTASELLGEMRRGHSHIFHFVGHGQFEPGTEEGWIVLCDDKGESKPLQANQLKRALRKNSALKLVVLNSCHTAQSGQFSIFSSTASVLLQLGVPAVIAMQYAITEPAALEFSRAFYEALADGEPTEGALTEARNSISVNFTRTLEWGTPALYTFADDLRMMPSRRKGKAKTLATVSVSTDSQVDLDNTAIEAPKQAVADEKPGIQTMMQSGLELDRTQEGPGQTSPGNQVSGPEPVSQDKSHFFRRAAIVVVALIVLSSLVIGIIQRSGGLTSIPPSAPATSQSNPRTEGSTPTLGLTPNESYGITPSEHTTTQATPTVPPVPTSTLHADAVPTSTDLPKEVLSTPTAPTEVDTPIPTKVLTRTPTKVPTKPAPPTLGVTVTPDTNIQFGSSTGPNGLTSTGEASVADNNLELVFPKDGATFDYPNTPIFRWASTQPLSSTQHFLLKIVHGKGIEVQVLDDTQWRPATWMLDAQPADGIFNWQIAICEGGQVGGYGNVDAAGCLSPLEFTPPSTFRWRAIQPFSPLPSPVFVNPTN